MGPIQASYGPIQNPHTASYGPVQGRTIGHTETRQVSKWSAWQDELQWYQNQPHMTAPYWPHSSPLWPHSKIPLQPLMAPFKGDNFPMQHHKIHQNVQLNKQRKIHPSRPSEHSWQPSQPKIITQLEQIKELYADVFEGIGCFPGKPYHINLDQSVTPVQTQCRPVPVHLKEVFKQDINKMLNAGILKPVEKATPWINSFVLVKGKNPDGSIKLRICLDPTNLNKAVIHEPYCSKTPEDIAHLLANWKVITVP